MTVDLTRLPIGTDTWRALVDHALSLGDLSEVGYLELKGALPFGSAQDGKRSAVILARAILGMSNRMPEVAARHLGGHGVVLVGISGQTVTPCETVDPADLRNWITPYLGTDGPGWEPVFIDHPDGLVLAVVSYPPQPGDPIYTCHKDYAVGRELTVRDGDVFVRRPGKTERASSTDHAALLRRFSSAPGVGAEVAVTYAGGFSIPDKVMLRQDISQRITKAKEGYLAGIQPPEPPKPKQTATGAPGTLAAALLAQQAAGSALSKFALYDGGRRKRYTDEVEEWHREALEEIPTAMVEVVRHFAARGRWRIANLSSRFLEDVRVEVLLPPGVTVLSLDDSAVDGDVARFSVWSSLPDRPPAWEDWSRMSGILMPDFDYTLPPRMRPQQVRIPEFDIEATGDGGTRVTWHLGTLRPDTPEQGETEFVIALEGTGDADASAPSGVQATWRVTARDVHHVFTGDLNIGRAESPGEELDL